MSLSTSRFFCSLNCSIGGRFEPDELAVAINQPQLIPLLQEFVYEQENPEYIGQIPDILPLFDEKLTVYSSAVATFYSPSDVSGAGGMRSERIRAIDAWRRGPGRYDTVFVETDADALGMRGLDIARVRAFFSFKRSGTMYPCALVEWFTRLDDSPDDRNGMWKVEQEFDDHGLRQTSIIHLDTIVRAAHLLPVYALEEGYVPRRLLHTDSLDHFSTFYVNKYIDHHAFEIAF